MESFGDLMSVPPMYRDIGSTFLAQQMPMPMMGMPYLGYNYGITPMKPVLSSDVFVRAQIQKDKHKSEIKKAFAVIGGALLGMFALAVLKNKLAAKAAAKRAARTAATATNATA